jgi:hypothetical protein
MVRYAKTAVAATFGLVILLSAGIASAECSPTHSASAPQAPADNTATGEQTPTRG